VLGTTIILCLYLSCLLRVFVQDAGVSQLLVQPPHDKKLGPASICHYTWGAM
jgi:hypothetical protein